jgi:autotransporter family porin
MRSAIGLNDIGDCSRDHASSDPTSSYGIYAENNGTDLTVTAASVSGGAYGIYVHNNGTGALSITATGTVTGTSRHGVYADNRGTALTVSTAAVSGGRYGIYARNIGSGALSITSTGAVTGTVRDGIYGLNLPGSTDLTIIAAAVSGGDNGIRALNRGSGALSITSTGPVTGTTGRGINALNADFLRVVQPVLDAAVTKQAIGTPARC